MSRADDGAARAPDRRARALAAAREARRAAAERQGERLWQQEQRRVDLTGDDRDGFLAITPHPPSRAVTSGPAPTVVLPTTAPGPDDPSGRDDGDTPGNGGGGGSGRGPQAPPPPGGGAGAVPRHDPTAGDQGPTAPDDDTRPDRGSGHRHGGGTNGFHRLADPGGLGPHRSDPDAGRSGNGTSGRHAHASAATPTPQANGSANGSVRPGSAVHGWAWGTGPSAAPDRPGHVLNGHVPPPRPDTDPVTNPGATTGEAEVAAPPVDAGVVEEIERPEYAVTEDAAFTKERFDQLYERIASPLPPTSIPSDPGWPAPKKRPDLPPER